MTTSARALPRLFIGADPGEKGALVALRPDLSVVWSVVANRGGWWASGGAGMPVTPREYGIRFRFDDMLKLARVHPSAVCLVVEHQHKKAREAGLGLHVLDEKLLVGVGRAMGFDVHVLHSRAWRAKTGTSAGSYDANKQASVDFCRARLPDLDLTPGALRSPKATGLADAGCIAWYGVKKWGGGA